MRVSLTKTSKDAIITCDSKNNQLPQQAIHIVTSSDNKNKHRYISRKQPRLPLDYDKYFVGRSYQLFTSAIRSRVFNCINRIYGIFVIS
jgi:hypothetical protein